ncbi:MAG: FecR family protein, partial [Pseudobacter sp.]|uniref:FecR family protein n=1 Tax=Pseudobacter sp. TaxID=2045420 RepID=UPI003F7EC28A
RQTKQLMPTGSERFQYLFSRYTSNSCTEAELEELFTLFRNMPEDQVHPYMDTFYHNIQPGEAPDTINWEELYQRITKEEARPAPVKRIYHPMRKVAVAASILLVILAALYYLRPSENTPGPQATVTPADIPPGKDLAVLKLADGSLVVLDSTANGNIAEQGGVRIVKQADGTISYEPQNGQAAANLFNTLSTPKGGQYRLTLPDGSKVWLNAASSIRYPASFNNQERRVEITGEAYFEVAKFRNLPFYVNTPDGEIRVLGTHFNVNAYANEPSVTTTLLEGRISITSTGHAQPVLLHPGQQASYQLPDGKTQQYLTSDIRVQKVDTDPVIAWTRNAFVFSNTSLDAAMRQIERWYDVNIIIKGDIANEAIMANLSRDIPISRVMHKLSLTGHLKFRIDGNTIIVTR